MKENSIEEDIKDIEKYISFTSKRENFSHDTDWNWNKDLANKIEHILSDYKRVLKINEVLLKENEELKEKIREHTLLISPYYVKENYIPVQKIKDKIEELNRKIDESVDDSKRILQELLESEE